MRTPAAKVSMMGVILSSIFLLGSMSPVAVEAAELMPLSEVFAPPVEVEPWVEREVSPCQIPTTTPSPEQLAAEAGEYAQWKNNYASLPWYCKAEFDVPAWFGEEMNENLRWLLLELTVHYGLSLEAAVGIAANCWYESHWEPGAIAYDGSGSYGLCQWLGSRQSLLWAWCSRNGLDASTVEGQAAYIIYELSEVYDIDLTGSAYDCAYNFCLYYEAPLNAYSAAVTRGQYAQELYEQLTEGL